MKISIIVPISDNYKDSDRAIISLINQTYRDIEILIGLNGNSKNYSNNLKQKFSEYKNVKFFSVKNKNIVDGLNFLIEKAKGKYIARLDCDDVSYPYRIEKQIKTINKKNLDFLSSDGEVVDDKMDKIYNHETVFSKKYFTNPILHPSIVIKANILKKFKYKKVPYAEDYELYLRLEQNGIKLNNLNEPLIFYQLNRKNIKNKKRAFLVNLSTLIIARSFRENLEVNEKFFEKINYDKKFSIIYTDYLNNYIFQKKNLYKIFYLLRLLFQKNNIIKKVFLTRLLSNFSFNKKIITKAINNKVKNKKPFISIIIPSFNSEKTILRTIKSILDQTYQNFEIIVIDNSKNLKTVNTIKKNFKSKKIKITYIEKRILNSEARNIGVKKSSKKSKIIAFCDSDDWWKQNKIEKQIKIMNQKNVKISCTNYDFYNPNTRKTITNYFKIPYTKINFKTLAIKNVLGTSSIMINKELFLGAGGFPENKYFHSFEDYFLWLKLARKETFHFIDDNLTVYRDDRNNSASKESKSLISQRLRIIFYYLLSLNFVNLFSLIIGNVKLFTSKTYQKEKNEYFNLL